MNEEDYKAIIAAYQQKSFDLFNQNIVLEVQLNSLNKNFELLRQEIERLKAAKIRKNIKSDSDFE